MSNSNNPIPESVKKFINAHINSVEQLEILLLLRAHPGRAWTSLQVSEELRTAQDSAAKRLNELEFGHLLASQVLSDQKKAYRYAPKTSTLSETADLLAGCYQKVRFRIIDLILAKPVSDLRTFANSFRFRKEDEET